MNVKIGEKLRELRKRDGRTQEDLANAVGVTAQAVSRWEMGQGYPDIEVIPAIANYFGVYIDELFGYDNEREAKINSYIREMEEMERNGAGCEERLAYIRNAVSEFPSSDKLLILLAEMLNSCGHSRYGIKAYTNGESNYVFNDAEYGSKNPCFKEELVILRRLMQETNDPEIRQRAVSDSVYVMRNMGMYEEALEIAETQPNIRVSRELLKMNAADAKEAYRYAGEALIELAREICDVITRSLVSRLTLSQNIELCIEKIRGIISLYELIFEDKAIKSDSKCSGHNTCGSYGTCYGFLHYDMVGLYMFLAHYYSRISMRDNNPQPLDDAFEAMRTALYHAKCYDSLKDTGKIRFKSELLAEVEKDTGDWSGGKLCSNLPNDWHIMDDAILEADPRFAEWKAECLNN